jgi:hypothetical protein
MDNYSKKTPCSPALAIANVQHIMPNEKLPRPEFFVNMTDHNAEDEIFLSNISSSDEAEFRIYRQVNRHNSRLWK